MNSIRHIVLLSVAAGCCAAAFGATSYTWTGAGVDAKWSNADNWSPSGVPTKYDNVTFDGTATHPDSTIDEDFAGQVNSMFVTADYVGTVTLARAFRVNLDFDQSGGTVDCRTFEFGVIGGDLQGGNNSRGGQFLRKAGIFKAPTGGAKLVFSPRFVGGSAKFVVGDSGFVAGADSYLMLGYSNSGGSPNFYATNQVFQTIEFGCGFNFYGTGNVVRTKFVHGGGSLNDAAKSASARPGGASFIIDGDIEAKGSALGGNLELIFNKDGDQGVAFGTPTTSNVNRVNWTPRLPGLHITKPSGTVRVTGEQAHFGKGPGVGASCCWGVLVEQGTLDFSAVGLCSFGCEATVVEVKEGAEILWATNVLSLTRNCTFKGSHTFNNFEVDTQESYSTDFSPWNSTNTVLGDVRFTASRIGGTAGTGAQTYSGRYKTCLKVYGDVYTDGTPNANAGKRSGGMINLLMCNAERDQTVYVRANGAVPNVIVDKPEGLKVKVVSLDGTPLNFSPGCQNHSGGYLQIDSGSFVASEQGLVFTNILNAGILQLGGKLELNGAPLSFVGRQATEGYISVFGVRDPLYDVTIDIPYARTDGGLRNFGLQVPSGYTNVINGKLLLKSGRLASQDIAKSAVECRGDFEIASHDFVGANGSIVFGGDQDQHYVNRCGYTNINSVITIAKTGGRLILDDDLDLRYRRAWSTVKTEYGPSQALAFNCLSGTLYSNGHRLLLPAGTTTVADGFVFAVPIAESAEPPFETLGTLSLPSAGSPAVSLLGIPSPDMPVSYDLWKCGAVVNPGAVWSYWMPDLVARPKVSWIEAESLYRLTCHYRKGLMMMLR